MVTESQVPENGAEAAIPEQLLNSMYEAGTRLKDADEGVLRWWGVHLLEDWKSLYLLAERQGH